ncbi:MAG: acyl-CoA thioesterase domain-containing protein [Alteraurantiacibacter sp.]
MNRGAEGRGATPALCRFTRRLAIGFAEILTLRQDGDATYIGAPGPGVGKRLFGGHTLAQGLVAATLAEDGGRMPHSLHAHFLKLGNADIPVRYEVATLNEGRSFATRRVDAVQGEAHLLTMTVSLHIEEEGHRHAEPMPGVPDIAQARAAFEAWRARQEQPERLPILGRLWERPVETVPLDPQTLFGSDPAAPRSANWMRVREPEPVDPATARAQLAYASDMLFLRNALLPHGVRPGASRMQVASLDHAMWLHETPDFSRWHLYTGHSPWAGGARGFTYGHFFAENGTLVATVAQENLMRVRS